MFYSVLPHSPFLITLDHYGVQRQAVCDQFEMEEQLKYNNFASEITRVIDFF